MADSFLKSLLRQLTGGVPVYVLPAPLSLQALVVSGPAQVIAPAANVAPNAALNPWITMTFTANTTCVIGIPTGVPAGQTWMFTITIINTSGGNLTGVSLAAAYKAAALTLPATTKNRSFVFMTDGTNAYEVVQTAADASN